jgi:Domain of unknown function (DUF1877)
MRMPPAASEAQRGAFEATPGAIGPFEQALNLEKSWHILHYLVTGHTDDSSAPGDALLTGESLGEDAGYGPARLHDEIKTREFGQFLETLDLAERRLATTFRFCETTWPGCRRSKADY